MKLNCLEGRSCLPLRHLASEATHAQLFVKVARQQNLWNQPHTLFLIAGTGCVRGRSWTLWRRSCTVSRGRTGSFVTRRNRWSEKYSTSKIYSSRSTRLAASGSNRTAVPKRKKGARRPRRPHLQTCPASTKRKIKSRAPTGFCLTNGSLHDFGSSFLKNK